MTDALDDLVATMDRLYSPGGCPWDAEQTHTSLVRYLLEEAHELAEAIETHDRPGMREELGDVLLQVVFHARIAADDPDDPFTVDDVAADLVAKLRRRHPHVFAADGAGPAPVPQDMHAQWDAIKRTEKRRTSVLEGIALDQGALARAQKVLGRAARAGIVLDPAPGTRPDAGPGPGAASDTVGDVDTGNGVASTDGTAATGGIEDVAGRHGRALLDAVRAAEADGVDAEAALRGAIREVEHAVRAAERTPGDVP
ncbi:XTP/dITP diphosphohydrolase [Sediminihabitans luteus]|uniref:XTP/dITP diphosphohydrolase n=1 Tax=Sediminihabitans luteus TaxID=1138585 RepID=A0A2M9CDC6_9CELL|nr:MazG family protein [Sediminihabitans luteus]PJJ69887.1 XTP/dITP diphosphohydrolase [Sediminihabitans luteus]GII99206.1 nucleotide pyrophosphohydrolase [Sediminihabitans luteus]